MNCFNRLLSTAFLLLSLGMNSPLASQNQTPDVSPIYPSDSVPFTIKIEQAAFALPNGLHSFAFATHKNKWLLIAGRTNGMHGFDPGDNNFPPSAQNTVVYVVDTKTGEIWSRNLTESGSGLSQHEIDYYSVTSPQFYQQSQTLYMTGGYGVDSRTGLFGTKDTLSAIDIRGMIKWVQKPNEAKSAAHYIRRIHHPAFQVTGGYMDLGQGGITLLMMGQNFTGFYHDDSNGAYTQQVRRFRVHDDGKELSVHMMGSKPGLPNPNYRRRDLNIVPVMHTLYDLPTPAFIALSGVFTETDGIWTVPVFISFDGKPSMENPSSPKAFKQGMNNYASATVGLFSNENGKMYTTILGGISYGYYQNGVFTTDSEFPFINQVTTVSFNENGFYKQYLMDAEYPQIPIPGTNPQAYYLFGAGAAFIPSKKASSYSNGVIRLDRIKQPDTLLGYVVGGIQSKVGNTSVPSDSGASTYIFRVTATKK